MFQPDEEPTHPFEEPWQAQVMALADTLVKSDHIRAEDWATALGTALRNAEAHGAPDTVSTYYQCVLTALEAVTERDTGVSAQDREERRAQWEDAYRRTPHGEPVEL